MLEYEDENSPEKRKEILEINKENEGSAELLEQKMSDEEMEKKFEENQDEIMSDLEDGLATTFNSEKSLVDRINIKDTVKGFQDAENLESEGASIDVKDMVKNSIESIYGATLDDVIESQHPGKLEWLLNPMGSGATEIGIWSWKKLFDADNPSEDLTDSKKFSLKMQHWANGLKIAGLAIPGIGTEVAVGLEGGEQVLRRASESAKNIDETEGMTSFEAAREMTKSLLPRDENGEIDNEKTKEWLSKVGSGLGSEEALQNIPEKVRPYVKKFAELVENNPEKLISTVEDLNEVVKRGKN